MALSRLSDLPVNDVLKLKFPLPKRALRIRTKRQCVIKIVMSFVFVFCIAT